MNDFYLPLWGRIIGGLEFSAYNLCKRVTRSFAPIPKSLNESIVIELHLDSKRIASQVPRQRRVSTFAIASGFFLFHGRAA